MFYTHWVGQDMFLESTYPDGNNCETFLHQETDILLADMASLLVEGKCFTIFSSYHIDHLQHHSIDRTSVGCYAIKIIAVVGSR